MSTRTTPLGLALIAALVLCAPAYGGGHFGTVGQGGFGFHGGFNRGFGFRGGFGWWGWPGYGLVLATLPLYYSTVWWNGVPYYYAYDNYYVWNNGMGGYQAVAPPPQVRSQAIAQQGDTNLFAYPKNSQSAEQQSRDRQECRNWAASQTGSGADSERNLRAQAS